ncbi:tyrosine-type recombinase/integrase [Thiothrix fructosivorans]|uniref:Tyrosine-type recombinase/integrase n=1 Tax=Thiothrix fructosivorans TaxID=111770 RepID=A0A8B0SMH6_9GAMM|nr:tyrosine-type recombinase/integrase [Thiothrix fructosivorans]MBO0615358.1 tyrosine-type recombinase/integrase [Thiothrix fructosivorans]QTX10132.1 tyrosine-type recombinase/integrase [Thiothrix fructosivorans]
MTKKLNFNKAVLEALELPTVGRLYVYDTKVDGLLLMLTKAGTRSFQIRKFLNGKAARVTLGGFPHMTVVQARERALRELSLIATTRQTSTQQKAEIRQYDSLTLGKAFQDYLKSHKNLKTSTVSDYERAVRVGFPDWQELPLTKITRDMVEARHRERSDQSAARANNEMRVLRCIFNYAAEEYFDAAGKPIITANPVKRLSHSRAWNRVERRQTIIKNDELPNWFAAVDTLPEWYGGALASKARTYFLLTLFSGYRRSESGNLLWENVDLKNNTIRIEDTKNHHNHVLPLTTFTRELLTQWQAWTGQGSGLVFRATDNTSPLFSVEEVIKAIRTRTGIQWTMHDLRRTFTTTAENNGVQGYTLKRLINHKTGAADVTGGYIVTDLESLREPMQIITDRLLTLTSAKLTPSKTAAAAINT